MPLRWGIVTAGKCSHDFCNSFNSYPDKGDMVIAAVAAKDQKRAAEFAKLHNIPKVYESYQALAASDDYDVAYIGAWDPEHYDLVKLYLSNGKHVLCEKPLCMNYKQAKSLINFAKQKNLFLMEAVWSRFSPAYIALEKEIQEGKLGEPTFVEVNLGVDMTNSDEVSKKIAGGCGIYYTLQFAQFIFKKEPIKVTAIGQLHSEGVVTVVLEYARSRRAVLNINTIVTLWNKATVVGTKGRATLEEPFRWPIELIHVNGEKSSYPLHESPIPYFFENCAGLVHQTFEVYR